MTLFPSDGLTGRRKIKTNVNEINASNVAEVLSKALAIHSLNAREITYLYEYYKGNQDIRDKVKIVREEINNKVVVNRANEIVTFKTSYLLAEPIQYISHGGDEKVSEEVNQLNEFMRLEDKESKDKEILDWMHICGLGERMVLPDPANEEDGAPFVVYTLDPREAFVIYSSRLGQKPMAGVILQKDEEDKWFATVYTKDSCFVVNYEDKVSTEENNVGGIPLVEYLNNEARMGAFEPVISILNNINVLESNAVDSVQDFVNGFDVFSNCDIEDGAYKNLAIGGQAIKIKTVVPGMEAKVYRVYSELNQPGVQTRIDDLSSAYLEICGMPNRNGGLSTSDTGSAVIFRDGFVAAHARAVDTATLFKRSEREFDRIVLNICNGKGKLDLKLSEFEPKFPLGNLVNIQSLAQIFCELLNQPFVHPKVAFEVGSGLFKDPELAYRMSEEWYETGVAEQEEELDKEIELERTRSLSAVGSDDTEPEQGIIKEVKSSETETTVS